MRTLLAAAVLLVLTASACGDDEDQGNDKAAAACDALLTGDPGKAAELAEEAADHDDKWEPLADALSTLSQADGGDSVGDDDAAAAIVAAADECAKVDRPQLGP